jgi:hypothetical protein
MPKPYSAIALVVVFASFSIPYSAKTGRVSVNGLWPSTIRCWHSLRERSSDQRPGRIVNCLALPTGGNPGER